MYVCMYVCIYICMYISAYLFGGMQSCSSACVKQIHKREQHCVRERQQGQTRHACLMIQEVASGPRAWCVQWVQRFRRGIRGRAHASAGTRTPGACMVQAAAVAVQVWAAGAFCARGFLFCARSVAQFYACMYMLHVSVNAYAYHTSMHAC